MLRALEVYRAGLDGPHNHFCPGESGSGEWRTMPTAEEVPCRCFYCKETNSETNVPT